MKYVRWGLLGLLIATALAQSQAVYNYFPPPGITYTPSAGMMLGSAAGGVQGAGTLNAQGLYVDGVSVGVGTVTAVSVVSANGISGTVANPGTTPAITLIPTFTGIAYSNGSGFSAALSGDFPTLNQNTTGTASALTAMPAGTIACNPTGATAISETCTLGTNLSFSGTVLNATAGGGGVSSFSGDGALLNNSGSTGAVFATLANTGVAYGVWGNTGSSSGAPGYHALSSYPTAAFPTLNQSTTGNAGTATALQSAPSQCSGSGSVATGIAASGNANCHTLVAADIPASITSNTSGTAAALSGTLGQCSANQYAIGIAASGTANCSGPSFATVSTSSSGCTATSASASFYSSCTRNSTGDYTVSFTKTFASNVSCLVSSVNPSGARGAVDEVKSTTTTTAEFTICGISGGNCALTDNESFSYECH